MKRLRTEIKAAFYYIVRRVCNNKIKIDVTGIILTPGSGGRDSAGNGEHVNKRGKVIECCCDECDYLLCCEGEQR